MNSKNKQTETISDHSCEYSALNSKMFAIVGEVKKNQPDRLVAVVIFSLAACASKSMIARAIQKDQRKNTLTR